MWFLRIQTLMCELQSIWEMFIRVCFTLYAKKSKKNMAQKFGAHTAWIWIWMTKRPGATSNNGFLFKQINENLNIKEKEKKS